MPTGRLPWAGTAISVVPTGVPVGRFNRHSGPSSVHHRASGTWALPTRPSHLALTIYAITHQGLGGAPNTVRHGAIGTSATKTTTAAATTPAVGSTTLA